MNNHCYLQVVAISTTLKREEKEEAGSPKSLKLTHRGDSHGGSHQVSSSSCGRSVPHVSLLRDRKQVHCKFCKFKPEQGFPPCKAWSFEQQSSPGGFKQRKSIFFYCNFVQRKRVTRLSNLGYHFDFLRPQKSLLHFLPGKRSRKVFHIDVC